MEVEIELKKTPLYDRHAGLGARIVDFHGWLMPIQYKGIVHEHLAVRNNAGVFDVSHMGEILIEGSDAYQFVQYLVTNSLDKISEGRSLYSALCREDGGMLDDLIIYFHSKQKILLIVNASNKEKDFEWLKSHSDNFDVSVKDISDEKVLLALQGPKSGSILEKLIGRDFSSLKRLHFTEIEYLNTIVFIARTGYTGEDGFEISVDKEKGVEVWDALIKLGAEPIGLGARDTLRLEKGFVLYGNEADEETTPVETGIKWAVDFRKTDFIGKEALLSKKPLKKRIRIEMTGTGIPRQGCGIYSGDKKIGVVTSGSFSPSTKKGIAMGFVDGDYKEIFIEIRGKKEKASIIY